jgi:hypothetical protein
MAAESPRGQPIDLTEMVRPVTGRSARGLARLSSAARQLLSAPREPCGRAIKSMPLAENPGKYNDCSFVAHEPPR